MRDATLGSDVPDTPEPLPPRVIAHVDMDAFFASIEQRDNPALKGLPVIIGADPAAGRGVVSTASYEARKFGVGSAMPISRAHRLCPQGVFIRPRISHYSEVSRAVFALFQDADVFEGASIDEAYLDVSSRFDRPADAREWAMALKRRVNHEHGITCSIGVGPNRLVAKIATDMQKPDGLTIVDPDDAEAFLAPLPVRKIPGIGPKGDARLEVHGIRTCRDLAQADPAFLEQEFGVWGPRLALAARGIDTTPVEGDWERKSSGAETTFGQDTSDPDEIARVLERCAEEAWEVLRDDRLVARTVTVKIRYADFTTFTRAKTLITATADKGVITDAARGILAEVALEQPLRLLGVRLTGLSSAFWTQETMRRWPAEVLGEAEEDWTARPDGRERSDRRLDDF